MGAPLLLVKVNGRVPQPILISSNFVNATMNFIDGNKFSLRGFVLFFYLVFCAGRWHDVCVPANCITDTKSNQRQWSKLSE